MESSPRVIGLRQTNCRVRRTKPSIVCYSRNKGFRTSSRKRCQFANSVVGYCVQLFWANLPATSPISDGSAWAQSDRYRSVLHDGSHGGGTRRYPTLYTNCSRVVSHPRSANKSTLSCDGP